jgi:hypothetical protein
MESFVYKWTYKPTLDWYVGFHKGTEDDGYVCSSKIVMDFYNINPTDWERTIISRGTIEDMYELETIILQTTNAKKDIRSFNRHNNDGWSPGAKKGKKYPGSHSADARKKKSEMMMGNSRGCGAWSENRRAAQEARKGLPYAHKGVPKSDEHKMNMSKTKQLTANHIFKEN